MGRQDPMSHRFELREKQHKLDDLARKARSKEDVEAEEELLKKTPRTEPITSDKIVGRNDPCPCGSGKKFKKCCGAKAK